MLLVETPIRLGLDKYVFHAGSVKKITSRYFQVYAYYKHLAGYISLDKGFRQQCQTLGTNIAR